MEYPQISPIVSYLYKYKTDIIWRIANMLTPVSYGIVEAVLVFHRPPSQCSLAQLVAIVRAKCVFSIIINDTVDVETAKRRLKVCLDITDDDNDVIDILCQTKRLQDEEKGTFLPYPGETHILAQALHDNPEEALYNYAQTVPTGLTQKELDVEV